MTTRTIYHFMKPLNQRLAVNLQRGIGPTRVVLLLTTTGRKTGLARVTPLQFEKVDDDYCIGSALGVKADWYCNILVDPMVNVEVQGRQFTARAEPVTDPERIADFIELRLQRHPIMIRLIMHLFDGLPLRFDRSDLVKLSEGKAMVILHPERNQDEK